MKTYLQIFTIAMFLGSMSSFGHEGHDIPGALPPAPHKGVIQEALHGAHDHHHGKEEKELFFEAVMMPGKELRVYPLVLLDGAKTFTPVKKSELSKISLKAENPRTKKVQTLNAELGEDHIKGAYDPNGLNRFFVHVSTDFENETKVAKIQVVQAE